MTKIDSEISTMTCIKLFPWWKFLSADPLVFSVLQMVDASIIPANEVARINALHRYRILDTPPDGAFERITALASRLLNTPISIISLVDKDRIWFKSHHGLNVAQIDREPGLCASAILRDDAYVLSDALKDPRSMCNPLVAGDFGLRFYAGVPLQTSDNFNLGVLCCLDFEPRDIRQEELNTLQDLSSVVMDQMELRLAARKIDELNAELEHRASHDSLTELWNRRGIMDLLEHALARAARSGTSLAVLMFDVDLFKKVNDKYGHPVGDQVLVELASRLKNALRSGDCAGRMGGEEFMAVLENCDTSLAEEVAQRCRRAVCDAPFHLGKVSLAISISIGYTVIQPNGRYSATKAISAADAALYQAKSNGRNCVVKLAS